MRFLFLFTLLASSASAKEFISFPPGFKFCTGVSSHQHEGNNVNSDWWRWEHSPDSLAKEKSGPAANHWEMCQQDLIKARSLNIQDFRFNVE